MVHIDPDTQPPTRDAGDCRDDPGEFGCPADADAVASAHGEHGPHCLPSLAAYAHASADTEY